MSSAGNSKDDFLESVMDAKGFDIDAGRSTAPPPPPLPSSAFEPEEHWVGERTASISYPHRSPSINNGLAHRELELVHLTLSDIPIKIKKKFIDIYRWDPGFADSQLLILLDEYNEMIDVVKLGDSNSRDESDDAKLWEVASAGTDVSSPVYEVLLQSKTLGMTIENVMERTIVRTINPSSEAAKLKIQANSLLLQVGNTKTIDNTHIETLDLLKNAPRPVKLLFRKLDAETVNQRRAQMQALVQRQKLQEEVGRSLDWLEERLLWSLRMMAFTEGIRVLRSLGNDEVFCSSKEEHFNTPIPQEVEDEIQSNFSFLLVSERTIAENARREVVNNVRMSTISDLLDKLRVALSFGESVSVKIVERDLREICFSLLQLRNDIFSEAPEPQDIDHRTIYTLKQLILHCVPISTLKFQAIPMMWRLAASQSVSGRMACSIFISVLYPRLPTHQKLQLRGLINRLSVDQYAIIRGHVLGVTCPKIMAMLDPVGLNWLAHCVTHSASDEDASVRIQAITACTKLIEFYARKSNVFKADSEEPRFPCDPIDAPSLFYYAEDQRIYDDTDDGLVDSLDCLSLSYKEMSSASPKSYSITQADTHLLYCRMLPMITFLSEDENSEVRAYIASCVGLLCRFMGRPWSQAIIDILFSYFRDPDERVRSASLKSVPATARAILLDALGRVPPSTEGADAHPIDLAAGSVKLLESFVPAVISLQRDSSVLVRSTLSGMLPKLLSYLWPPLMQRVKSSDNTHSNRCSFSVRSYCPVYTQKLVETVAPTMIKLLGDPIKVVAVQMLTALSDSDPRREEWPGFVFSGDRTKEVLSCLSPLASHHLWRSRHAVCVILPCLASVCNSVESRAKVAAIAVPLVTDDVFEVSRSAARALCLAGRCDLQAVSCDALTTDGEPVQDMGRMWLDAIVLPQLHKMQQATRASVRIMALHMIVVIILEDVIEMSDGRLVMLLDIALQLSKDKVANVRMALAAVLKAIAARVISFKNGQELSKISNVLELLSNDKDRDVSYSARQASIEVDGVKQTGITGCELLPQACSTPTKGIGLKTVGPIVDDAGSDESTGSVVI